MDTGGTTSGEGESRLGIERRGIEHIPESERHGRPRDLFTLWFSSNVQINAVFTGGLAILLGLDLKWAILSILIGNLVGGLFMAYHSIQGPRMGMPQMIQSRAQFGLYGALLPQALTVVMYMGFYVVGAAVIGKIIATNFHLSQALAVIIFNVIVFVIALVGYDLIHAFGRWMTIVSGVLFLALFIKLAVDLPAHYSGTSVTLGTILLIISICASWQITWAPYVSDYSRYLPRDTPASKTFWFTYVGAVGGASWVMILGAFAAMIAVDAFAASPGGYLGTVFPSVKWLVLIAIFLGILPASAESPYGSFLTIMAGLSPSGKASSPPRLRFWFCLLFTVVGTILAIAASDHLIATLENFVLFLLYLLVPWTAINLTDYFLVRRGQYAIDDFYKKTGVYGLANWWALAIYVLAIAVEIPFINTTFYVGPMVSHLGGADISWILGLVVSGGLYYVAAKWSMSRGDERFLKVAPLSAAEPARNEVSS